MTSKAQVAIPKSIRERLGIEKGTTVRFEIHDDGTVTFTPERGPWELLEEIRDEPRETDRSVAELLAESKRAWSHVEWYSSIRGRGSK